MAYEQKPGSTASAAGGGQYEGDASSGVSSYPIAYNTDQNTTGGYQYTSGVTGNLSGGGEYSSLDTVDSVSYQQLAAQKAADAALSAAAAAASAIAANNSAIDAEGFATDASNSAISAAVSAADAAAVIPSQTGNAGKFLSTNGTSTVWSTAGTGTVTSVAVSGGTTGLITSGSPITSTGTITLDGTLSLNNGGTGATSAVDALSNLGAYPATNPNGYTNNTGTVTSVAVTVPTGLSITGSPVTTSGTLAISNSSGYAIPTTTSQTNWDAAYADRNKWDGGAAGLVASTGRTSLGLGTIATQDANAVSITGGAISGITDLAIADGGTGASNASDAFNALAPTTTKGDLIVRNSTVNTRIPVGANNQILVADSTQSAGIKWADNTSGSNVAIQDEGSTLTSAVTSINFTGAGVTATNVGSVVTVDITSGGGSGDVVGPSSAVNNNFVLFDGTTGKLIKDGSISSATFATAAQGTKADTALQTVASADGSIVVTTTGTAIDLAVSQTSPASVVVEQVRNTTGATLTKGTAVYISGATGQLPTVSKALATSDATSAQTLGLITNDISNNSNGYVTIIGLVTNLNTSDYTDGVQLYLSPTTAGTLTTTKPHAPEHMVYVAVVAHAHPTQGKLFVKVQNGYEMDELHNVSAQSPSNGQTLIYNTTTSLWEKASLTAGTGVSVTNGAGSITIANTGVLSLTGTTNEVEVSASTGAITLSLPSTINANTTGNAATATNVAYSGLTGTVPTWNQDTTGNAANVTGIVAIANGGTGQTTLAAASIPTYSSTDTLSNKTLEATTLTNGYTEEVFAVTGTTPALSPTNGSIQTWTLSANSTPTAGTWAAGQSITLMVDDGTAYTITWTSLAPVWVGGTAPSLATSGYTVIQFWKVGSTIYGALTGAVA